MKNSEFTALWKESESQLTGFVRREVRDHDLAKDIVQDVFVRAYVHLSSIHDLQKAKAWVFQIARNAIADHFRKSAKILSAWPVEPERSDDNYNECVSLCLQGTMNDLPSKYRQALELTLVRQLSQTHLAKVLQISYSGAKTRVQRARQLLKDMMHERYNIQLDAYGNAIACEGRMRCNCN